MKSKQQKGRGHRSGPSQGNESISFESSAPSARQLVDEEEASQVVIDTDGFSEALDAALQESITCPLCNKEKVDWEAEKKLLK